MNFNEIKVKCKLCAYIIGNWSAKRKGETQFKTPFPTFYGGFMSLIVLALVIVSAVNFSQGLI